MKTTLASLLLLMVLSVGESAAFGDETGAENGKPSGDKNDDAAAVRDLWSEYYASQLPKYQFFLASDPDARLDLPDAKLRWSNPLRPGTHGDLFVWSHQGRGVLVGSIFSYRYNDGRRVAHQFQSLSTETIRCEKEGGGNFEIAGPGLEFEPIPDAPAPAPRRVLRLVQMRRLARQFEASGMNKDEFQPLRPLAQPIYRFEGDAVEEDGAIFAFVMGTDPELLLVLSTLETTGGPKWHYAAARFASDPLRLSHLGATIWEYGDRSKQIGYVNKHGIDYQPNVPVFEPALQPLLDE